MHETTTVTMRACSGLMLEKLEGSALALVAGCSGTSETACSTEARTVNSNPLTCLTATGWAPNGAELAASESTASLPSAEAVLR